MTLNISSDISYKYYEVITNDERFENYPLASRGGWRNDVFYTYIDKKEWFKQLRAIAEWVSEEYGEECQFQIRG